MSSQKKQQTVLTCMLFSIACLVSLSAEYLILQCEQFIYEKNYFKFTISESVVHWVLICFIWGMIGSLLLYLSVRVYSFNVFKHSDKPTARGIAAALILIFASVSAKYIIWDGWKILADLHSSGWFQFIFQYIYYLFEVLIVLLTVVFAQEAGEKIFNVKKAPWGGFVLAVTWGLSHIVTQSSVTIGLYYTVSSIMYGTAYIALRKNLYFSYLITVLMFLL